MEDKERAAVFLCQAEGEHSRLAPRELCSFSAPFNFVSGGS